MTTTSINKKLTFMPTDVSLDDALNMGELPRDTELDRAPTAIEQATAAETQHKADEANAPSLDELVWRTLGSSSGVTSIGNWMQTHGLPDDPNYELPNDLPKLMEAHGVPINWMSEFEHVNSADQFNVVFNQLAARADDRNLAAHAGGAGIAGNIIASSMDPVSFAMDTAATTIGGIGAVNRFRRIFQPIASAGVGNVIYANMQGDPDHKFLDNFVTDYAAGAAFGALFKGGEIAFSPTERAAWANGAQRMADTLKSKGDPAAEAEAAANAAAGPGFGKDSFGAARVKDASVVGKVKDAIDNINAPREHIDAPELDKTATGRDEFQTLQQRGRDNADVLSPLLSLRFDSFASWAKNKWPEVRQVGREFFFDPVQAYRVDAETGAKELVQNKSGLIETANFMHRNDTADFVNTLHNSIKEIAEAETGNKVSQLAKRVTDDEWQHEILNSAGTVALTGKRNAQAPVNAIVDAAKEAIGNAFKRAKAAGVKGTENIEHDASYFPRMVDPHVQFTLQGLGVHELPNGGEQVTKLFEDSLASARRSAGLGVDEKINRQVAEAYSQHILRPEASLDHFHLDKNLDYLENVLTNAGIDENTIKGITDHFAGKDVNATADVASNRFKERLKLDMNTERVMPNGQRLRMTDLFDKNVERVTDKYTRELSGHSAFAERGYTPDGMSKNMDTLYSQNKMTRKQWMHGQDMVKMAMGRPLDHDPSGAATQIVRAVNNMNFARMMGQVFWSQMADSGASIASAGLRATKMHIPAFNDLLKRVVSKDMTSDFAREIAACGNPGSSITRGTITKVLDPRDFRGLYGNRIFKKFDRASAKASAVVARTGGIQPMVDIQQQLTARALGQRIADFANGKRSLSKADIERFVDGGFSEANVKAAIEHVKQHATFDQHGAVTSMGLDKMDNGLQAELQRYIYRETNRVILEHTPDAMPHFMHSVVAKIGLQFRGYTINAYSRRMLHGLVRHDVTAGASWMYGLSLASMAVLGRTWLNFGSDSKQMQELLDGHNLALAAIQQTGESSILPLMTDTVMSNLLQRDPIFSNRGRSSGQKTDLLGGMPIVGLAQNMGEVLGMPANIVAGDRQVTDRQMRALSGLTMFGTMVGTRRALNAWAGSFPHKKEVTE